MRRSLYSRATKCRPFAGSTLRSYRRLPLPPSKLTCAYIGSAEPDLYVHRRPLSTTTQAFFPSNSTIYALSTASGRAGIAIVRISGPGCLDIYRGLCPGVVAPRPRYASVRTLRDPTLRSNIIDSEALLLYFPAPKTVTGEDVLELHIHGGPATVRALLSAIPQCPSAAHIRYAEPGEFTRRAFQNNRLDLAQVESLSNALSAETEQQRRSAVKGHSGVLGKTYEEWRQMLLYARGEVEAIIDFSDDQDFDVSSSEMLQSIESQVKKIRSLITLHIEAGRRGELLRKGIRISMLGPPNAGKSSLLNRIAGREASIVSSEAGTTRDIIEVSFDLEGYLCTFADTAGLRNEAQGDQEDNDDVLRGSIGLIEQEGIRRAKQKAKDSDLILVLVSIEPTRSGGNNFELNYDADSLQIASKSKNFLVVVNKMDVVPAKTSHILVEGFQEHLRSNMVGFDSSRLVTISCKTARVGPPSEGEGNIKALVARLVSMFKDMTDFDQEDLHGVTERQNQLLHQCNEALYHYLGETSRKERACLQGIRVLSGRASPLDIAQQDTTVSANDFEDGCDVVVAAEHLRSAAACLSRITGRGEAGDVEEVLGVVFEKFCVGK